MNEVGFFGKIPAHGDFVWQSLPARFVTPWDNWLQSQLMSLKERQPTDWLETYLCGPMWRFVIQDPALGASTWCGVIAPSVDIVGRYFPLTIATALPLYTSVVYTPAVMTSWLSHTEDIVLEALSQALSIEDILGKVLVHPVPEVAERPPPETSPHNNPWEGQSAVGVSWAETLLDQMVYTSFESPCYWSTEDAETGSARHSLTDGFTQFSALFGE